MSPLSGEWRLLLRALPPLAAPPPPSLPSHTTRLTWGGGGAGFCHRHAALQFLNERGHCTRAHRSLLQDGSTGYKRAAGREKDEGGSFAELSSGEKISLSPSYLAHTRSLCLCLRTANRSIAARACTTSAQTRGEEIRRKRRQREAAPGLPNSAKGWMKKI